MSQSHRVVTAFAILILTACADATQVTSPSLDQVTIPLATLIDQCGIEAITCNEPEGTPQPPSGAAVPGFSQSYCRTGIVRYSALDVDGDQIRDACELPIARAFAPMLVQSSTVQFHPGMGLTAGDYLFAVGSVGDRTSIAYLPSYYIDGGAFEANIKGHSGDSEYIIVEVSYRESTAKYYAEQIFLSAHCQAGIPIIGIYDPYCRWYPWWDLDYVNGERQGVPIVWVADSKHANYRSFADCMSGTFVDRCDMGSRRSARFPIDAAFHLVPVPPNAHLKLKPRRAGAPWVNPEAIEDFYTIGKEFNGWQLDSWGGGSTPPGDILRKFAIFPALNGSFPPTDCGMEAIVCK